MSVKIYDSTIGAFKDAETPLIWDEQAQAWKDSVGLVWNESAQAWEERWGKEKVIYTPHKSIYPIGVGYSKDSPDGRAESSTDLLYKLSSRGGVASYPTVAYENAKMLLHIDFSCISFVYIKGIKKGTFYIDYIENPTVKQTGGWNAYVGAYAYKKRIKLETDAIDAKIDTKNWNCTDSALSFTNYDTYNSGCMYEITEISIRK